MLRRRLACLQHITPHPSGKPDTFPSRGRHYRCSASGSRQTALLRRAGSPAYAAGRLCRPQAIKSKGAPIKTKFLWGKLSKKSAAFLTAKKGEPRYACDKKCTSGPAMQTACPKSRGIYDNNILSSQVDCRCLGGGRVPARASRSAWGKERRLEVLP